jgi:hypothetical protein
MIRAPQYTGFVARLAVASAVMTGVLAGAQSAAAQTAGVIFDRSVYQVAPGETFDVQVLLDADLSTPEAEGLANGLFSYSWTASFDAAKASVDSITVPSQLDYFGFANGASITSEPGLIGAEGNIDQVALEPYDGGLLATISLTNLAPVPDEYVLALNLASHLPKEELFLDGKGNVLDEELFFGTARVIVAVPEPASVSLMLCGAAGALLFWRRRAR